MKWWQDLMVWLMLLLVMVGFSAAAYFAGIKTVVESCDTYRAYKPDKTKVVFCMVLPITEQRGVGEKAYIRPEGVKVNPIFKRT